MGGALIGGKPSFNKQQFLQKQPGGSFQNYQSFLRRKRGVAEPKPARPRALPTLSSLLGSIQIETPAQLEARANRMTQQGITSQQGIIREEAKMMRDEAQRRMEAMSAAGRAAAQMNAGLMGSVGGEYNAAAQELRNLGSLGGSMGAMTAADVGAQDAALASVGAPGLEATGAMAGPGQAGVETYRGATLPGQAIDTAGQAATFGLAGLVGAQNLYATQSAQAAFVGATRDADRARVSALKELAMGRPAQAAQFLAQLQDAQRQQVALASGLIQQRSAEQAQGFGQNMATKEYGQKVKQQGIENARADRLEATQLQALGIDLSQVDAVKSQALGYVVDKRGRPLLDDKGKRIPAKRLLGSVSSSKRSMTPGQRIDLMQKAQTAMETAYYGYMNQDGKRVPATEAGDFDPQNPQGNGRLQYSQAVSRLAAMGVQPAYARQLAAQYYQRGEAGRPIVTTAERRLLAKQLGVKEANRVIASIQSQMNSGRIEAGQHRLAELLQTIGQ
jgi:hypothetical protein